jgi:hypothetical protein
MNCCSQCFLDPSLKKIIVSLSEKNGVCDFCESVETPLVTCETLSESFEQLFELYSPYPHAEGSLKIEEPFLLYQHLDTYWAKLFNRDLLDDKLIKFLVDNIGRGGDIYSEALFQEPVEFSYIVDGIDLPINDLELEWDSFADDIKHHNRFFLSQRLDTDLLQSIFERLREDSQPGTEFYRARLSESLLDFAAMGKPPAHATTAGRANPVGIPYLYLSNDLKTTLYETRISLHETLTIAKFVTTDTLNFVSLKNMECLGPFRILDKGFEIEEFIKIRPYLLKLESELSKPVRKQDVHLDYLPTQFLCEFFKSMGFDAVEYKSAMNPHGGNLALFNDNKVVCVETKFYKVNNLTYVWDEL